MKCKNCNGTGKVGANLKYAKATGAIINLLDYKKEQILQLVKSL